MDSKKLCRLCSDFREDFVNIFQDFENSTIAAILSKHFAFQIYKGDGFSDCLCQTCWTNTKKFHIFYKKMETLQSNHSKSNNFVDRHTSDAHDNRVAGSTVIKVEPDISPVDMLEETNSYAVKTEDTNPAIAFDPFDLQVKLEEHSDASYNPSEDDQTEDEEESPRENGEPRNKRYNRESENSKYSNKRTTNRRSNRQTNTSKRDAATEDAQIREFCNMKCEICCEQFETFTDANQHYRTAHNTGGYLTCCRKKFDRRYRVLEHIRRHLNPEQFKCDTCGKTFANKFSFKNHIENHETRAFKCDICPSSFTRQWKLENHKRRTHCTEEDKKFQCDQCNKKFLSKSDLNDHIRGIHEAARAQVCDICAKVCKNNTTFLRHMQTHSTVPQPRVQCNICGMWQNKDNLRKHKKRHHEASANCTICNKVLQSKLSLTNHMRHVHGERHHKCTMCDKAFTVAFVLKEHMTVHTGELQYTCKYCKKLFKTKSNMSYHQKKVHLEELTKDRSERLNC